MNAIVNIVCYRQKTLKNGEHPLMIRVSKDGKKKYKSIGISVHPDHWDFQKNKPKNHCPNKDIILKIILDKEVEFQKEILGGYSPKMSKITPKNTFFYRKMNENLTKCHAF